MNKMPVFDIGVFEPSEPEIYRNPVKIALQYQEMLDGGKAKSQAELAQALGVSRAKVTQMLNVLKLDEEIKAFMLSMDDGDERLSVLTERKLRSLVKIPEHLQKERFWGLVVDKNDASDRTEI